MFAVACPDRKETFRIMVLYDTLEKAKSYAEELTEVYNKAYTVLKVVGKYTKVDEKIVWQEQE